MIKKLFYFMIALLAIPSITYSTTLFESDWATATGTTESAITDGGNFTPAPTKLGPSENIWYQVLNDSSAPGSRNFIRFYKNSDGAGGYLRDSTTNLGHPASVYVRLYFRLRANWNNGGHLFFLRHDTNYGIDTGCVGVFDLWGGTTNLHTNYGGAGGPGRQIPNSTAWSAMDVDDNEWHRWELKIDNSGTSTSSITVRIDDIDRTSSFVFINDPTDPADALATWNGSITNQQANYIEFQVYDTSGGGSVGEVVDITGLKITDGPTWIGDDIDTTSPTMSNATIPVAGNSITITYSEPTTQGTGYNDSDIDIDCATAGNNIAMTYSSGNGTNSHVYTLATPVLSGDTCNIDFNGDADSLEDGSENDLAAISSGVVTNSSTQAYPVFVSAAIDPNGRLLSVTYDQNVRIGSGGTGGVTLTSCSGGAVTIAYTSNNGATVVYGEPSRTIQAGETGCVLGYTQPGNGIEANSSPNYLDVQTYADQAVTNNSTAGASSGTGTTLGGGLSISGGGSIN